MNSLHPAFRFILLLIKHLSRASWLPTLFYLILIAALTALFLWRLSATAPEDRAYLPEKSDLAEVFLPPRAFFAQTLANSEFALWNPHVYAGYPQFADPQAATFYPVALLLAWFNGTHFSIHTIAFDIGLHFFLVGAFSFLFFRHLFQNPIPALLSALVFEFGGYLTFYPPLQLSELEVVAWLPLALLLVTLSLQKRNPLLMTLAGLSLGQVFLAGRPQSYLTIGLITFSWLVYTAHHEGFSGLDIVKNMMLLGLVTLGTAAAQWVPTLQLTKLSSRSQLIYSHVAEGGFPFAELSGFFATQLGGTQNLYMGLLTLLLAGLAAYKRQGLFWLGLFGVCLLGSVGKHLILFDAFYLIERLGFPGYLRNVERLAFGLTFALAALSGYGLQALAQEIKPLFRVLTRGMAALFGLTLLLVGVWVVSQPANPSTATAVPLEQLAFTATILFSAFLILWLFLEQPPIAQGLLVALAVIDVMSVNQGRFFVAQAFLPGNDLERIAAAPVLPDPYYRVVFDQTSSQDFGSLLGVDNVGGMPPLQLVDYDRLRNSLDEYRRNILLNVGMVVTTGVYSDPAFALVAQQDNFSYYRFTLPKPRAYLVPKVVEVADAVEAVDRLAAPDFDYWHTAVVQGSTGLGQGPDLAPTETAVILSHSANSLTIETTTTTSRFLVVVETNYPGWHATLDGQPMPLYQTNGALRGVVVPAGTHRISLRFRPTTLWIGTVTSLLTSLSVLLWAAWANRPRR